MFFLLLLLSLLKLGREVGRKEESECDYFLFVMMCIAILIFGVIGFEFRVHSMERQRNRNGKPSIHGVHPTGASGRSVSQSVSQKDKKKGITMQST